MSDVRVSLREIIRRSVMGESKLWPIDPKYPAVGSFEDRYRAGDKQILLWAINQYAQEGQLIPDWAAKELNEIIYSAAEGKFASWDDAFGKIFAGKRQDGIQTLTKMLHVYSRVCELAKNHPIDNLLFERVGEELNPPLGKTRVQELYLQVKSELDP
jgi:hypothetical protein